MYGILFLSRDGEYRDRLISLLQDSGYNIFSSDNIEDAVNQFCASRVDLIIVDVESWKGEGITFYKELKFAIGMEDCLSIIIASADQMQRVRFSLAFDDFVIKKEDLQEVILRIRQLQWHQNKLDTSNIIKVENLIIDINRYEVSVKGKHLTLTYKEYELLKFLILNSGRVFSRETLLNRVWGYDNYAGTRTVDIHIQRLRNKLGGKTSTYIRTIRNVGYCFITEK